MLLAPGPLLLVSGSWLLVCLLITPYSLGEVRGGLKLPNKVWNVYMGKRETKNQTLDVDMTTDTDDLNLRLLKYIISRKYGIRGGKEQCMDKPEEDLKKNLLQNIMNTQEEDLKKTLVEKIKFRDWFRLTKRGITA